MTLLLTYIVRHIATGKTLNIDRGSSWWDPTDDNYIDEGAPRLFKTRKAAINFISAWVRGHHMTVHHDNGDRLENKVEDIGRTPDMLTIVPVALVEEGNWGMGDKFAVGDAVSKVSGYKFPGVVTAVDTFDPDLYLVMAVHPDIKGMRHVFRGKQLQGRKT